MNLRKRDNPALMIGKNGVYKFIHKTKKNRQGRGQ
jgi:hypothetical protein